MLDFLSNLFDTSGFPPRWQCGSWTEAHGWLHILSDLGIWSAYFAIPCILVYFVLRRRDVPFSTIFWLFGAFILACGTTHLMEAIIFWHPVYRLAGVIKVFTAAVSWATVVALVPIVPKALAMRSPEELEQEVAARKKAELALQQANADLERRVEERTAELAQANAALQEEREQLEAILRTTPTPIWIAHDPQCHYITGNPASFALLGLGLHGGTIEARSSPGKGSEFIVRLPVVEGAMQQTPPKSVESGEKPRSGPTFRILVADDNRDAANSLAMMLRLLGHDIQSAHDGVEAVQAAAVFRPDVALLDIGMPKMNGYEAARNIRGQPWGKQTVLVALTGWGQEEDKRKAAEAGFHYHLTKPVEPGTLERLLEGLTHPR